jgi:hypothetical protein
MISTGGNLRKVTTSEQPEPAGGPHGRSTWRRANCSGRNERPSHANESTVPPSFGAVTDAVEEAADGAGRDGRYLSVGRLSRLSRRRFSTPGKQSVLARLSCRFVSVGAVRFRRCASDGDELYRPNSRRGNRFGKIVSATTGTPPTHRPTPRTCRRLWAAVGSPGRRKNEKRRVRFGPVLEPTRVEGLLAPATCHCGRTSPVRRTSSPRRAQIGARKRTGPSVPSFRQTILGKRTFLALRLVSNHPRCRDLPWPTTFFHFFLIFP